VTAPAPAPASRLNHGDLVAAAGAGLLVVLMFSVEWYGVAGIPGRSSSRAGLVSAEDAWHSLSVIRWLMMLTVLVALASSAIHVRPMQRPVVAGARLAVLMLGTLTFAAVAWRVLIAFPTPDRVLDQKLGAFLGVISALGIALGGYEAVREQRTRLLVPTAPSRRPDALPSGHESG
jgi:hypothetical protein